MILHRRVSVLIFSVLFLLCAPVGPSSVGAQGLPVSEWSYCDSEPDGGLPLPRPSAYASSLLDREGLSPDDEAPRRAAPHCGLEKEEIARVLLNPGF